MTEHRGRSAGLDLDGRFRDSHFAEHLKHTPRWTRYMAPGTTTEEWREVLHSDSDGLDQARLMIQLTNLFLKNDPENTVGLNEADTTFLMKAMATQNWGKSFDDEQHTNTDVSYELITANDIEHRMRKFHTVYQEIVPEADVKERFIVAQAIYDKTTKLGKIFDAVRRLNCLRTGLIAYETYSNDPDNPKHENLKALPLGVMANQLIPLIGYASDFAPVRDALGASSETIDAIFADKRLRHSDLLSSQQTIDGIEHAQMVWERVYLNEDADIRKSNKSQETIFSSGSAFEKRFVNDKHELEKVIEGLRAVGMRIVLTSGSFDLLHIGHAAYLEKASEFGDILIVGVDSDAKIRKRKGESRPVVSEDERVRLLSHLRGVSLITLKDPEERRWALIKLVRPDILVVTAETYEPSEIRELEEKYCGQVVVLEPQATTSTGAQIRKIEIGAAQRETTHAERELGARVVAILEQTVDDEGLLENLKAKIGGIR